MNEITTKNRSIGIDLIKLIAIFSVVMIHVSAQYLTVYCTAGAWQFDASAASEGKAMAQTKILH